MTLNRSVFGSIIHKTNFTEDDHEDIKSEVEIDHSASFLQYGGLAKINEQLTLGFSFTPEWEWEWDKIKSTYDGENSNYADDDIEITVPSVFGFGVTSQLSPTLLIAAEYQNRKYSDVEISTFGSSGIDDLVIDLVLNTGMGKHYYVMDILVTLFMHLMKMMTTRSRYL